MSSTNRGGKRSPADFYPTPSWCVRRLLEAVVLPPGHWVEPCAGDGAIIRAVNSARDDVTWTANELLGERRGDLAEAVGTSGLVRIGSFEAQPPPTAAEVAITNPPFSLAMPVVEWSLKHANISALLLRLNFIGSAKRAAFMRVHPPDVFVLPNRPSFDGKGTDSIEYAWFVWRRGESRHQGKLMVLPETSKSERSASHGR